MDCCYKWMIAQLRSPQFLCMHNRSERPTTLEIRVWRSRNKLVFGLRDHSQLMSVGHFDICIFLKSPLPLERYQDGNVWPSFESLKTRPLCMLNRSQRPTTLEMRLWHPWNKQVLEHEYVLAHAMGSSFFVSIARGPWASFEVKLSPPL